jgi:DNA-binding NarL/FixJ family response regulator
MMDRSADVDERGFSTQLLICDDEPAARRGLRNLLTPTRRADTVRVVDAAGLVDAFTARPAHLVLIGVHGTDLTAGPDPVRLLLAAHPTASVIVYGRPGDAALLATAVAKGARGLMLWDPRLPHRLPIFPVAAGTDRRAGFPAVGSARAALTERELQILQGMSAGSSNGEIGRHLFLAEDTVKTHARRLFSKLGAQDRAHAVALGLRSSLLT